MDKSDKEILVEIDRYIRGKLNASETDELWKKFLIRPEYYSWFETELHLRNLGEFNNSLGNPSPNGHSLPISGNDESVGRSSAIMAFLKVSAARRWVLAAAAIFVLTFGVSFFLSNSSAVVHQFALEQIDYSELSGAGIVRSDGERAADPEVALNQGLAFAYSGQESAAEEQFQWVIEQSADPNLKSRAEMNLGIIKYNLSDFSGAESHFKSALSYDVTVPFLEEKTGWFLANTYLNLDMFNEAKSAVERVIEFEGRFETEARDILVKLETENP